MDHRRTRAAARAMPPWFVRGQSSQCIDRLGPIKGSNSMLRVDSVVVGRGDLLRRASLNACHGSHHVLGGAFANLPSPGRDAAYIHTDTLLRIHTPTPTQNTKRTGSLVLVRSRRGWWAGITPRQQAR